MNIKKEHLATSEMYIRAAEKAIHDVLKRDVEAIEGYYNRGLITEAEKERATKVTYEVHNRAIHIVGIVIEAPYLGVHIPESEVN